MLDKVASCRLPLHRGSTVHPDRATQHGRNAMRLKDKIGIVTAAGSGMGRAGAIRFAKEGAKVAVVDLDGKAVDSVVKEITAAGSKAIGITVDLREDANARRIVRETANEFGGLDFVWNHLGHPGPASVEGIDMADFALAVDLNLRSQIVTTEAALPELKARGGGSLLYTASTSGLVGSQFSPVYSAVKFGVVGFVRALAKRIAKAALFLLSDEASFITGAALPVDDGTTA